MKTVKFYFSFCDTVDTKQLSMEDINNYGYSRLRLMKIEEQINNYKH